MTKNLIEVAHHFAMDGEIKIVIQQISIQHHITYLYTIWITPEHVMIRQSDGSKIYKIDIIFDSAAF